MVGNTKSSCKNNSILYGNINISRLLSDFFENFRQKKSDLFLPKASLRIQEGEFYLALTLEVLVRSHYKKDENDKSSSFRLVWVWEGFLFFCLFNILQINPFFINYL